MSFYQKKVITINDLSCIGKCSITVIHPILSCAGFETMVLPTSLLSHHTAFPNYSFLDLTNEMNEILSKWNILDRKADCVLSGFLGDEKQIKLVEKTYDLYAKNDALFIVDPVMADNGKLYPIYNDCFPEKMLKIVKKADIIIPNITEACYLLKKPYKEHFTIEEIKEILYELSNLGPTKIILTGVEKDNNHIGAAFLDKDKNKIGFYFTKRINKVFHGTGDVFTASFVGAYMNNLSLEKSMIIAVKFTYRSILKALKTTDDPRFGVPFETEFKYYLKLLNS